MRRFIVSTFSCILLGFLAVHMGCSKSKGSGINGEKIREFANVLYNQELYSQAIREYQRYLDFYGGDEKQEANIDFIIGNIYFDRLHDYENALAYYLKIKYIFPETPLLPEAEKQIVACLERMQRSADAKQSLDEATGLVPDQVKKPQPGRVIARIGEREFTTGDLKYRIEQLPEYMQSQFKDKKSKIEFLKQLVAADLLYDAAKRKGLDKNSDVVEGAFQARKSMMVQKYLEEEIAQQIKISNDDVQLYYQANLDKYAEKDEKGKVKRQKPFDEVQKQVANDLVMERQQKAYNDLIQRMLTAEKVEIYDDLVE